MFDLAIHYRMVGGFVGLGSTALARLRWAVTIGAYMAFCSLVHHEGWLQCLIVFAGCSLGGFLGRLIPHARFQANTSVVNFCGMAAVNIVRLALIVFPYAFAVGSWYALWTVFFGIGAGIAYTVGWKYLDGKDIGIYYRGKMQQYYVAILPPGMPSADPNPSTKLDRCAVYGSEWGECLTGLLVYQLMFLAALVMP